MAGFVASGLGSAWIGPTDGTNDLWKIPAAALVLLIPFFFISYLIEYFVVVFVLDIPHEVAHPAHAHIRYAVRNANITTYLGQCSFLR